MQGAKSLSVNQSHQPCPARHPPHSQTARAGMDKSQLESLGRGKGVVGWGVSPGHLPGPVPDLLLPPHGSPAAGPERKVSLQTSALSIPQQPEGSTQPLTSLNALPTSVTWGQRSCLPRVAVLNMNMITGKVLRPRPDSHTVSLP